MFNGIIYKTGIVKFIFRNKKSLLIGIKSNLNFKKNEIGSSVNCDGQVLVTDDLIGLSQTNFKFVKKYANISRIINSAVLKFKSEVLLERFPKSKHSFKC